MSDYKIENNNSTSFTLAAFVFCFTVFYIIDHYKFVKITTENKITYQFVKIETPQKGDE